MMGMEIVREKADLLVCETRRSRYDSMLEALAGIGAPRVEWRQGRVVQLLERSQPRWLPFHRTARLFESPADVFSAILPPGGSEEALEVLFPEIIDPLDNSSFQLLDIEIIHGGPPLAMPDGNKSSRKRTLPRGALSNMTEIVIVVSRGKGNDVAGAALERGLCVPSVDFAIGGGIRDRLGLIRVAVPPEKEVVRLIVPGHDSEIAAKMLIDSLRLDQPGRGFVYGQPVRGAIPRTRLRVGEQSHAATIEQVIGAIDNLHGGTDWRRRLSWHDGKQSKLGYGFHKAAWGLSVVCPEELSRKMLDTAIDVGAGGSISFLSKVLVQPDDGKALPEMSRSSLVLASRSKENVTEALLSAGIIESGGHLEITPCSFILKATGGILE